MTRKRSVLIRPRGRGTRREKMTGRDVDGTSEREVKASHPNRRRRLSMRTCELYQRGDNGSGIHARPARDDVVSAVGVG
jgi:hypothetical protein